MKLEARLAIINRAVVVCTSDMAWRNNNSLGCANYSTHNTVLCDNTPADGASAKCCSCGGGRRVHPVHYQDIELARIQSSDAGFYDPSVRLLTLSPASLSAAVPQGVIVGGACSSYLQQLPAAAATSYCDKVLRQVVARSTTPSLHHPAS